MLAVSFLQVLLAVTVCGLFIGSGLVLLFAAVDGYISRLWLFLIIPAMIFAAATFIWLGVGLLNGPTVNE